MMFRERLLRCHPTKTCYLIVGLKKWKKKVKEELEARPLMFGSFPMKEKDQDVYLGDILSSEGLGASVEATVRHRMAKVKGAMYEVAAIMADHHMQAMGGMEVAWQIWEKSFIPSLLANCGSWVGVTKTALKTLNSLQCLYCKLIYSCPDSTPIPSIRGKAGFLDMDHRIMIEKVCLVTRVMHVMNEEGYAKAILQEQMDMKWDGLSKEVTEICDKLGLPDACTTFVQREEVTEAALYSHLKVLKEEYSMEKLKHLKDDDIRYMQDYMKMASLEGARLEFRYRVGMLDNRANMGKQYKFKHCPQCPAGLEEKVVESSQHWMECEAYKELRLGLDPEGSLPGRLKYIRSVQALRIELEKYVL